MDLCTFDLLGFGGLWAVSICGGLLLSSLGLCHPSCPLHSPNMGKHTISKHHSVCEVIMSCWISSFTLLVVSMSLNTGNHKSTTQNTPGKLLVCCRAPNGCRARARPTETHSNAPNSEGDLQNQRLLDGEVVQCAVGGRL